MLSIAASFGPTLLLCWNFSLLSLLRGKRPLSPNHCECLFSGSIWVEGRVLVVVVDALCCELEEFVSVLGVVSAVILVGTVAVVVVDWAKGEVISVVFLGDSLSLVGQVEIELSIEHCYSLLFILDYWLQYYYDNLEWVKKNMNSNAVTRRTLEKAMVVIWV